MKILVVNAGSSSLKYQLLDMKDESVIAKGNCDRIGIDGHVSAKTGDGRHIEEDCNFPTHTEAFEKLVEVLTSGETKVIDSMSEISAVGHRIVQGAEIFKETCLVTDEVIDQIDSLAELAPVHNHPHALALRACKAVIPAGTPQVVVFDTAFHSTMPRKAYLYGLPYECYTDLHVRKYGFHGTSHSFVSKRAVEFLGLDKDNSKVIVCHLGNGSSISAVVNGQCVDTTMGLTPLEGVVMGTRSGNIDPAIMEFIAKKENLDITGMMNVLNKKSGLLGLSGGLSSDFRDLNDAAQSGNEDAANAIDVLCYGIAKFVGGYVAAMNGVDAIVFTAGIGENAIPVREKVVSYLGYLGVTLDKEANGVRGEEIVISTPDSKVKVAVIPTNEELAICRETVALV